EDGGRLEPLLATALPRAGWLGGHVAVTLVGTLLVLALAGLGLGTSYALVTGDGGAMLRLALPAMTFAPAVLV
ncbi:MAG TPA: ABC transporter permease, partial [Nocardioides sp.]|nr:ABC transporter permease [Nocardioides sp.]